MHRRICISIGRIARIRAIFPRIERIRADRRNFILPRNSAAPAASSSHSSAGIGSNRGIASSYWAPSQEFMPAWNLRFQSRLNSFWPREFFRAHRFDRIAVLASNRITLIGQIDAIVTNRQHPFGLLPISSDRLDLIEMMASPSFSLLRCNFARANFFSISLVRNGNCGPEPIRRLSGPNSSNSGPARLGFGPALIIGFANYSFARSSARRAIALMPFNRLRRFQGDLSSLRFPPRVGNLCSGEIHSIELFAPLRSRSHSSLRLFLFLREIDSSRYRSRNRRETKHSTFLQMVGRHCTWRAECFAGAIEDCSLGLPRFARQSLLFVRTNVFPGEAGIVSTISWAKRNYVRSGGCAAAEGCERKMKCPANRACFHVVIDSRSESIASIGIFDSDRFLAVRSIALGNGSLSSSRIVLLDSIERARESWPIAKILADRIRPNPTRNRRFLAG